MFIVLISPWVQQTAQFTPLVSELSLIRSHLLWGEFSAFSADNAISQFSIFSFHQVPITAGWTEAVWYERFCPTTLHTSNFSDLRELVTLPCATICVRQTASLYQQVLHCHSESVVSSTGRHQTATPYMPLVRQRREQRSPAMGVRCLDHSTTTAELT